MDQLPIMESTPLEPVFVTADDMVALNDSVNLIDLDQQPVQSSSNDRPENILLVSQSIDGDYTAEMSNNGYLADNSVTEEEKTVSVSTGDESKIDDPQDIHSNSIEVTSNETSSNEEHHQQKAKTGVRVQVSEANQSPMNTSIFSQSLMSHIEMTKITKTNKGNPMLLLKDNGILRGLSIVGGGISKKGKISWTCFQRGCQGTFKTQIKDVSNLLEQVRVGNRNRTILKKDAVLSISNLRKLEGTPHTCDTKMEERQILNRIGQEVEKLVNELPPNPTRRPQRNEIREQAVSKVFNELNYESLKRKRLSLPRTTIPRKVSRAIRAKYPKLQEEITVANKADYDFDVSITEGHFELDKHLAATSNNDLLLFYNQDLLQYLTTGDHTLIADGNGSKLLVE